MRILIVNYRYFISGGPEKYLFNIKRTLEKNGHEVIPFSVLSDRNVHTKYSRYFVSPIGDEHAVYYKDVKKSPRVIWQLLTRSIYSLDVKKALKKEIHEIKPDVVYIIHYVNKLSPSVIDAAKEMNVPVVLRLSDYFLLCPRFDFLYKKSVCEDCLTKGYHECIKKRCVKNSFFASLVRVLSMKIHKYIRVEDRVDAFVTPSMFLKRKLEDNGYNKDKLYCIPTFTDMNDKKMHGGNGGYGLYFGRISEEKGVETLIYAFEKMPDLKIKIMGDDSTDEAIRLKKYVVEKNISNIEFLGFKQGCELDDIIAQAGYVIIPSVWYDNLPNTALEAFKFSKPVIAAKIGSLPELVQDGVNGYLFEPGNVESLICKVKMIQDDNLQKKMGDNSKKILLENFSEEVHYQNLIKLFERVKG